MNLCRHCGTRPACRPKGLCWAHYYDPAVRALCPSTSKHAYRGTRNFYGPAKPPETPTRALPATKAKVRVLARRAERGEDLWHPLDSRRSVA